jgi:hypothetical protein
MAAARKQGRNLSRFAVTLSAALVISSSGTAVVAALMQARSERDARRVAEEHRPVEVHSQDYVSSNECRSCHPSEYASWSSSYHRSMTQVATARTVMGKFDGVRLSDGQDYVLGHSDDAFYVDITARPGAVPERHPITLITGSHHMQTYWFETGHDRSLGQLPFVFLNADQRWVPRDAIFIEPPQAPQRVADGRWNAACIACHTTLGQPRIDASGKFDTQVAEFGIACEACHGPGEEHVARNRSPLARYAQHFSGGGDQSIVQPRKLTHERASYICGQCHATLLYDSPASMRDWNEHGPRFRPGGDLPSSVWLLQPSRANADPRIAGVVEHDRAHVDGQFWSDGVMRVSGREFNGMVDSPCYERGELSCSSCHAMHQSADDPRPAEAWHVGQLAVGMEGDRGCLQCHAELAENLRQHTQHAPESEGSRCYNCHMPYTSYGLLKALRSHRIDVPSVAASVDAGRPNACNLCHLDKSLGWTARQLSERYGLATPPLEGDDATVPFAELIGLRGDAGQRALIAWAMGWAPAQAASKPRFAPALLGVLMDDPYDAVRYIAERSLRSLGPRVRGFRYDFVSRPADREPVAAQVAHLMQPDMPREERERMRDLFSRLLESRDDKPVRLLE